MKVAEVMQEYGFEAPPAVRMNGVVDTLKRRNENDLHFDVDASLPTFIDAEMNRHVILRAVAAP